MAQTSGSPAGILNVLLHGTFAYNQEPEGITAFIPKIKHHVYRAGNWLGETDLRPGAYKLEGVRDLAKYGQKGDKFDLSSNLIIKPRQDNVPARSQAPYATLNLGKPRKITSLRVAPVRKADFQPPEAQAELVPKSDPLHIATLQIFTYDIEDESSLQLQSAPLQEHCADPIVENLAAGPRGHYWEPVFSGDFVNLHIFSEEDHHDQPSFGVDDLLSALNVLGSQITKVTVGTPRGIEPGEPLPDGVSPEETEDLAPRTKRMARLGRLVLQNGDPNQAWYANDALDEDPPACGSPVLGS
jgi:hypothetical protein